MSGDPGRRLPGVQEGIFRPIAPYLRGPHHLLRPETRAFPPTPRSTRFARFSRLRGRRIRLRRGPCSHLPWRTARPATVNRVSHSFTGSPVRAACGLDFAHGMLRLSRGAAHVTVRAVQLAFRRHLDTTPMAYLRRVRLETLPPATPGCPPRRRHHGHRRRRSLGFRQPQPVRRPVPANLRTATQPHPARLNPEASKKFRTNGAAITPSVMTSAKVPPARI